MARVLTEVMDRAGAPKDAVEDVVTGCVSPTDAQGANIGRLSLLKAGFPIDVPGVQINRMCGSSQQSVHFVSQAIAAGDMDLAIAGGVEMMGRVPMGSDWGVLDQEEFKETFPFALAPMGVCAERLTDRYGVKRDAMDAFAAESHRRGHAAKEAGYFHSQIMPVEVKDNGASRVVNEDEGIRASVDLAKMATLKSPFKEGGAVTAANASQISDGAAAVLLASEDAIKRLGLKKRARIVARVVVGGDPELTLSGPIPATKKALERAGLTLSDIDVVEINEAFACVVLVWAGALGADMAKVNPNGGAIAHGHPLGATGAILMTKMVNELERTGGRYGLQTMCIGHGMATATIIERMN
jgi:acetyl-CoA acetyltransferase family protein